MFRLFPSRRGYSVLPDVVDAQEPLTVAIRPADNRIPSNLRSLLTRRVVIAIGNHAVLSLVETAFIVTQPLFFSTPIAYGGLGLPPSTIGKLLFIRAIVSGSFQLLIFARIHEYWGSKRAYQVGMASLLFAFGAFPLINHMARTEGLGFSVWIFVAFQAIISSGIEVCYGK